MAKEKGITREENRREIIGLIIDAYIVMNGEKRLITRLITMEIGVILIIRGSSFKSRKLERDERNYSPIEIEFCDIDVWGADSELGHYLVNNRLSGEYRDAE